MCRLTWAKNCQTLPDLAIFRPDRIWGIKHGATEDMSARLCTSLDGLHAIQVGPHGRHSSTSFCILQLTRFEHVCCSTGYTIFAIESKHRKNMICVFVGCPYLMCMKRQLTLRYQNVSSLETFVSQRIYISFQNALFGYC